MTPAGAAMYPFWRSVETNPGRSPTRRACGVDPPARPGPGTSTEQPQAGAQVITAPGKAKR